MAKKSYEEMKEQLLKRTRESNERKDGGVNIKFFKPELEEDIKIWRPTVTKDEPHLIDILPYQAGDNPPQIDRRHPVRPGEWMYCMEIFVHDNLGPLNDRVVVCPARNYGLPCPVCENIAEQVKEGAEWEDYSDIALKRRCVYNVAVYDDKKEEEKGAQIWEVAHKYSEKQIQLIAKQRGDRGLVPFSHPSKDVGKSIQFSVGSDKYKTISGFSFVDRVDDVDDKMLEGAKVLDEIIEVLPYEDIKALFTGSASKEAEVHEDDVDDDAPDFDPVKVSGCPFGHVFGVDIETHEDCKKCSNEEFEACSAEADRLQEEEKRKKEEEERKKKEEESSKEPLSRRRRRG